MKYILNNENMKMLKKNIDVEFMYKTSNKEILYALFDDDVEFIVDDEIFVDVADDIEFIENIYIICIIQYFLGSLNNECIENLNYYLYKRFSLYDENNIDLYFNLLKNKSKYYSYFNNKFFYNSFNKNIMNFIYKLLNKHDLYLNEYYNNIVDYDDELKNEFIIDEYDIKLIFDYVNNKDPIYEYNELIECLNVLNRIDMEYDIDEIFEINNNLSNYVDYDNIIGDLIMDGYYHQFKNYYIHNNYF